MTRIHRIAAGAALAVAIPAAAIAATPERGEVSSAKPKVKWAGEVTNSYFSRILVVQSDDDSVPCDGSACDEFTLGVKNQADLQISADTPGGTGTGTDQVTLRIYKPDGSYTIFTGDSSSEQPFKVKITNAATGDYRIQYWNNYVGTSGYNGAAELLVPPVETPGPGTTPPPGQPTPTAFNVSVKTGKASAKKLNRSKKLVATVTTSREASIVATLKAGKKAVGKGTLAKLNGTGKVTLKLSKKLKKGTYSLAVQATDANGTKAGKTIKVKVSK